MTVGFIDLHMHSTASDGSNSPTQLVHLAVKKKLKAIALTDHETLSGLEEAEEAAQGLPIEVIRGVEIAAKSTWGELHILGYFVPANNANVAELLQYSQSSRIVRNKKIVRKLQDCGVPITYEEVVGQAGTTSPGRPHIAQVLVQKKVVRTIDEAFSKYVGRNGCAMVAREPATPQRVISTLVEAGATVSLAHPCLLPGQSALQLNTLLEELYAYGLQGVEAYHSSYSAEQTRMCLAAAKKFNLLVTGGSDYHGTVKPHVQMGSCHGGRIPAFLLDAIKQYRGQR